MAVAAFACGKVLAPPVSGNPDAGTLPATCTNGARDLGETDLDCGGSECTPCEDAQSCVFGGDCASGICTNSVCTGLGCSDGLENGSEIDVDCGPSCGAGSCNTGQACEGKSALCSSGICTNNLCTGPTQVTGLTATPGNAQIQLAWQAASSDVDIGVYNVQQQIGCKGSFTQVVQGNILRYLVTGLTNGTTYCFRIAAQDTLGNIGPYSLTASATPQP